MTHQVHDLKTLPVYWDAVYREEKTFEVRYDDRGFQKGDILRLLKTRKKPLGAYEVEFDLTGKPKHVIEVRVTWILTGGRFGIEPGYVVMGIARQAATVEA